MDPKVPPARFAQRAQRVARRAAALLCVVATVRSSCDDRCETFRKDLSPLRACQSARRLAHGSSVVGNACHTGRSTRARARAAARAPAAEQLEKLPPAEQLIVKLCTHHEKGGRHAITAAPTKRPRTLRVLQPAVVTVTDGSAWTPVATLLYFRKGQTWFALIWPQREQRYFFVSPPLVLDFREGAGETELTLSGSTKSGSAAFVGFRRRPVLRAAREGFGFGAGAGGGGGICGIARSSSSRSKESKRKPSPSINGWVASSI